VDPFLGNKYRFLLLIEVNGDKKALTFRVAYHGAVVDAPDMIAALKTDSRRSYDYHKSNVSITALNPEEKKP